MLGERAARVRRAGREYKRLIDARADVSQVRERLLDPSFDFEGFLHTAELFAKPVAKAVATPTSAVVKAKQVRGTQLVNLGGGAGTALLSGTSLLPSARSGTVAVPSRAATASAAPASATPKTLESPRGSTRLLSIGFHAEAHAPRDVELPPLDARLEGFGRSFALGRALFGLGRAPDCDVPIDHEAVAGLHAQILRRGNALYLRDAGSRTGTWLNDRLLVSVEALFDGDRLRIGPAELVLRAPALRRSEPVRADTTTLELELEVRSGRSMGLSFALRGAGMLIGSAPGSSIELAELSVAPQHARIRKAADQVFVTDLGSGYGTWLGGAPLPAGVEAELSAGAWLRIGAVDLVLTRGSVVRAAALRPRARLRVDAGPGAGTSVELGERTLVGSANTATLSLAGLAPAHLELLLHNDVFWARDLAGGRSFRSGSPLSGEFVELRNGDVLLLGQNTLLRFEEVP